MKTEKILAMIYQAAEQLPEEARSAYQYAREKPGLYNVLPDLGATLGALAHQLEEEATREAAKRCGAGAKEKTLRRKVLQEFLLHSTLQDRGFSGYYAPKEVLCQVSGIFLRYRRGR